MPRRVRKKSLELRDSSDINHTRYQVRQSIVHVFDEGAKAAPDTTGMSASARSQCFSKTRSDRVGLHHANEHE